MYVYVCVPVCACMRVRVCVRMCVHEYTGFLAAAFWHVWRGRIPQQDEGLVYAKIDVLWWRADVRRRATDARVREGGVEAGVDGYQGAGVPYGPASAPGPSPCRSGSEAASRASTQHRQRATSPL